MDEEVWIDWAPPWAKAVTGKYTKRRWDPYARMHEDQVVMMHCDGCGADWVAHCASGRPREHIEKFARAHYHGDPFKTPTVIAEGTLRLRGKR